MRPNIPKPLLLSVLLLSLLAWAGAFATARAQDVSVQRGAYLARAADCVACHTAPGGAPYAGGYAVSTPFGKIYGPNITPDRATGIGGWSDAQFLRAVRKGVGAHGEYLYPAMPYSSYARMTPADVLAIKAYLFSLPPVRRAATPNDLLFPLQFRPVLWIWRLFNPAPAMLETDAGRSAAWNRGRYLVEAAGHCGECHSPRTLTEGEDRRRYLGGGPLDGWTAFNITSDPHAGIGAWRPDEIARFLATGRNAHASASGPMAEAVSDSTRFLSASDLQAMATYLKTVPAIPGKGADRAAVGGPAHPAVDVRGTAETGTGAELFLGNCATCHGDDGAGRGQGQGAYPSLFHHSAVGARDPGALVQVILNGVQRTTNSGPIAMPAFGGQLDDAQTARLANYVRVTFGPGRADVSPGQVAKLRDGPSIAGLQDLEIFAAVAGVLALVWAAVWIGRRRLLARGAV